MEIDGWLEKGDDAELYYPTGAMNAVFRKSMYSENRFQAMKTGSTILVL